MRDLRPLLAPRSVAVVGASSDLTSLPGKPVRFLRDSGADVTIYPVNPGRDEIGGYRAYRDPADLPEAPDVGLVVVPAAAVVTAVEALAKRGTRAAIVVSSGFAEGGGAAGAAAQLRLGEIAREYGMALLGPNTLGVHDYVRGLPLSFVWYGRRAASSEGSVAVVSQSGSGMTSLCDRLLADGLPVGLGIATGNEADVTLTDVLEYLAEDDKVRVIATVFEEVRDGPRFLDTCRRLQQRGKTLVALKVGRTVSGSEVVRSHTGALAGSYPVLRALLRQYGVVEVTDLDHVGAMVAAALLPARPSVDAIAVVTNSGGAAGIAADRADDLGIPLAVLGPAAQDVVRELLPSFARGDVVANPIDLTAQSMQHPYAMVDIAEALVADPAVGGVVVAVPSGGGPDGVRWSGRLVDLVNRAPKPIVAVILSAAESDHLRAELRAGGVPVMSSPARAVEALMQLRRAARSSPVRVVENSRADPAPVPLPAETTEATTLAFLAAYGIPVVPTHRAATADEAAAAAELLGFPVAVKIESPDIVHKTEVGGVVLGCADVAAVRAAYERVTAAAARSAPEAVLTGVVVAPMVSAELELIAGVQRDPTFGAVVILGLGGIWAEMLGDVAMRGLPVDGAEVERMVDELQGAALLRGARGRRPVDRAQLADLVQALGRLAVDHADRLQGLDLNPVAVTESGRLVVLDAALYLSPA